MGPADERGRIERVDRETLEARVREAAERLLPGRVMDDLEVRHLVRVITESSLVLADVYSDERLARIMRPSPDLIAGLIDTLAREQAAATSQPGERIHRLPDEVRVIGDKALFDLGMLGRRQVKGYDLADLGARAYRSAGEALELLAEDRQLTEFFKENRLLMLPLEEEVVFLRQCSDQFQVYADILRQLGEIQRRRGGSLQDLARRVPLMAAAAEALGKTQELPAEEVRPIILSTAAGAEGEENPYLAELRPDGSNEIELSREMLLSGYERMLLFAGLRLAKLREAIDATVVDQTEAVAALCDEFSLFAAGTRDPRKPPAYFLVGPTGVGKNHLVETLCRVLGGVWQIEVPVLTIEAPNYTYPSDINELRGATRGFIRSDEQGLLTAFHEKSSCAPLAVILVDEVEKAHPQLLTFFLSILDRGTTTDNRGQLLNFANCMVFFTSNIGYSDAQQRATPIGYTDEASRRVNVDRDIYADIRRALKPEFVNRVRLIHFNRLTRSSVDRILDLEMERIAARYRQMHGLEVLLDESARLELIRRGFSETLGARRLAATLESVCNVELARMVRRDDRAPRATRDGLVTWIREMREGKRAFKEEDVRRQVVEHARAKLPYDTVTVVFDGERFLFETEQRG